VTVRASNPATPESLLRPEIFELGAYRVADATDLIKLDAMENPYPWPGALGHEWLETLRSVEVNRYPDPAASGLKAQLRTAFGVPKESALLLGNGSDELIQTLAMAVAAPGRCMLALEPSFVMYRMVAAFTGLEYRIVSLRADFSIDEQATLEAIKTLDPALVFVAYPNNPTGNCLDVETLLAAIDVARGLVVVDEAYFAFCEHSFLTLVPERPNLLVMRTLSKLGLAGLRLGFLVGAPAWIEQLEKLRLPYNVNTLTQLSASFALHHLKVLEQQAATIKVERARLATELASLDGVEVFPSDANFLLFRVSPGEAQRVFEGLLAAGILIKNLSGAGGLLHDCLRVTVGTADDNGQLLTALGRLLG
jgi:histidinol-phosphate aminotransferase